MNFGCARNRIKNMFVEEALTANQCSFFNMGKKANQHAQNARGVSQILLIG